MVTWLWYMAIRMALGGSGCTDVTNLGSFHPPQHPQQKCIDKPGILRGTEKTRGEIKSFPLYMPFSKYK